MKIFSFGIISVDFDEVENFYPSASSRRDFTRSIFLLRNRFVEFVTFGIILVRFHEIKFLPFGIISVGFHEVEFFALQKYLVLSPNKKD
jgi:hypothetical protein